MPELEPYKPPVESVKLTPAVLRERVGGALGDAWAGEVGATLDADFQALIDEEWQSLIGWVLSRGRDGFLAGADVLQSEPFQLQAVPSGHYAGLYEATIDGGYFPFVFRLADAEGRLAEYDRDALRYRRSPYKPFRYFVDGRVISFTFPYVAEGDASGEETVTAVLATEEAVVEALASERLAESNARVTDRAYQMVQRRIAEHGRQDALDPA